MTRLLDIVRHGSRPFMAIAFILAFIHATVWSAILPLWQTNDEFAHFEVAALTARYGRPVSPADADPALQARILRSMWLNRYWEIFGLERPERPPSRFVSGNPPLPGSAWPASWVIDDVLVGHYGGLSNTSQPLYYLALTPVAAVTANLSIDDQLRALRFGSRIMYALAVAVIARAAWVLFAGNRALTAGAVAFAVLHPMFAYIGAGLNNDNGAALAGAVVVLLVVSGWKSGFSWKRLLAIGIACVAAMITKRTTIYLLVWVPLVLAVSVFRSMSPTRRIRALLMFLLGGIAATALAIALHAIPGQMPAGWFGSPGARVWTNEEARTGSRAFKVSIGGTPELVTTMQLSANPLEPHVVTVSAWSRGGGGLLRIIPNTGGIYEQAISSSKGWQPISITLAVEKGFVRTAIVLVAAEPNPMVIDDVSVAVNGENVEVPNPSAEDVVPVLGDVVLAVARVAGVYGQAQTFIRDYRANLASIPGRIDIAERFLTVSFWGRFGNFGPRENPGLDIESAGPLSALMGLAAMSLAWQIASRRLPHGFRDVLLISLAGVALLLAQTFAPLVSSAAGGIWLPQGRYLFSGMALLCPLMALASIGPFPDRWRRIAAALLSAAMFIFAFFCALQSFFFFMN